MAIAAGPAEYHWRALILSSLAVARAPVQRIRQPRARIQLLGLVVSVVARARRPYRASDIAEAMGARSSLLRPPTQAIMGQALVVGVLPATPVTAAMAATLHTLYNTSQPGVQVRAAVVAAVAAAM